MRHTVAWMAVVLALCCAGAARAQAPVTIGVLTDESGPYSDAGGKGSAVAAQLAVQDFGGTVLGRPIRILLGDHKFKPEVGITLARKWFDEDGVDMITDLDFSPVALAVQHLAEERGRISIVTGAATNALLGKDCSPTGFMWTFNTYTSAAGIVTPLWKRGGSTWALIVADYAYGNQVAADVATVLTRLQGKIVGTQKFPFGATDFSGPLLASQGTGAKVVGLAAGGSDIVNAIAQADEFQIGRKQTIAALGATIFDFHSVGLEKSQGLIALEAFYWDRNEETRAFAARFSKLVGKVPGEAQAATYSAVLHYLKSVAAAGTDDGAAVARKMRDLPVDDMFSHGGRIRADGWLDHDQYLVQVKAPSESHGEWDIYKIVDTAAAADLSPPLSGSECRLVGR